MCRKPLFSNSPCFDEVEPGTTTVAAEWLHRPTNSAESHCAATGRGSGQLFPGQIAVQRSMPKQLERIILFKISTSLRIDRVATEFYAKYYA